MAKDLYAENQHLRRQLKAFVAQARSNEQKFQRFQAQELRLISTRSLAEFVQIVLYDYRASFELDYVTLSLIDPAYEIQHILEDEGMRLGEQPGLKFLAETDSLDATFGPTALPRLGGFAPDVHRPLLGPGAAPHSVAVLPLMRYGELIGSLNLGSHNPGRFELGVGTEFLERLAAIVAICLENAINHERLKRVGLTDFLTGVNNRRFFDQRLAEEVIRAEREQAALSCLLLDLDNFKAINDTHGHQAGDRVLKETAALVRKQLRRSDVLARYGGEEFAALLIGADGPLALEIAERTRAAVAAATMAITPGLELQVTLSAGVATLAAKSASGDPKDRGEGLVDRADQALYQAKEKGKNRVVCIGCPPMPVKVRTGRRSS